MSGTAEISQLPTDCRPGEAGSEAGVSAPGARTDATAAPGAPASGAAETWLRWRPSVVTGFAVWLTGLVVYFLVTAVAWLPFEDVAGKGGGVPTSLAELLGSWHRWDTTWYVIIADAGYQYDPRSTAFFPLYPMVVRGANGVLPGGGFEAALLVSAFACLAALIMVHRLTAEMLGPDDAKRAAYYLLAFPTGFYLVAAYNESLFIALAVAALYCMRRGHWWTAGALAGLAGATRMAGTALAVAFVYEYLRQRQFSLRRIQLNVLGLALAPVGLGCYMFYCAQVFGDPLHFLESQASWFRSGFTSPLSTVVDVFRMISDSEQVYAPPTIRNIVNLATALGVLLLLVLALVGPWRLGRDHAYLVIFAATIILMPLSNPIRADYPLSSMWRFALECTVVFMVLARMGRNAHFDRAFVSIALALQGVMLVTFIQNNFVA